MADMGNCSLAWLARENIKNYEEKLYKTQDENERRKLRQLIDEERNKLKGESQGYGK